MYICYIIYMYLPWNDKPILFDCCQCTIICPFNDFSIRITLIKSWKKKRKNINVFFSFWFYFFYFFYFFFFHTFGYKDINAHIYHAICFSDTSICWGHSISNWSAIPKRAYRSYKSYLNLNLDNGFDELFKDL